MAEEPEESEDDNTSVEEIVRDKWKSCREVASEKRNRVHRWKNRRDWDRIRLGVMLSIVGLIFVLSWAGTLTGALYLLIYSIKMNLAGIASSSVLLSFSVGIGGVCYLWLTGDL